MLEKKLDKSIKSKHSRGSLFLTLSSKTGLLVSAKKYKDNSGFSYLELFLRLCLYVMPVFLFFSYFPVISLGSNESMNFELSLPLIWLAIFDLVGFLVLIRRKTLFIGLRNRWLWLLFPTWLLLSVLWSLNTMRGILTAGILWLIYFAGYVIWSLRDWFDGEFRKKWLKGFFGVSLVVCVWCVVQCVLDLIGVSSENSLMCDGCTYRSFGFPHPNGFAIEPQFMGNLLLAPVMVAVWSYFKKFNNKLLCFFILTATLFLTFSRGAIYAFVVGMLFMSCFMYFGERRKKERIVVAKRIGIVWGITVLSFLFTLNLQGIMAQVSPTNDTYLTGIEKVLNHLSLGVIDIRVERESLQLSDFERDLTEKGNDVFENEVVENYVENYEDTKMEAIFDGYVSASTDTRLKLTSVGIEAWSKNAQTILFGVGLGGAGVALFNDGLLSSPKEIVQNEYITILLETGIIGISLFVLTMVLIIMVVWKKPVNALIFALLVSYGVSLLFFSGLANALQIYLLPIIIYMVFRK